MKTYVNQTFVDKEPTHNKEVADNQLAELFQQVLKEKGESASQMKWVDDSTIELGGQISPLALHSFVLEAQKLGKEVTYKKKTIIEIV